jgi:hypothetical protein
MLKSTSRMKRKVFNQSNVGVISDIEEDQQSSGDQVESVVLEEQGIAQQKRIPWTFRMNEVMARWYGIQLGKNTPHRLY